MMKIGLQAFSFSRSRRRFAAGCKGVRTLPDQRTLSATLGTLAQRIAESSIKPPALIVVGSVVGLRDKLSWFEHS